MKHARIRLAAGVTTLGTFASFMIAPISAKAAEPITADPPGQTPIVSLLEGSMPSARAFASVGSAHSETMRSGQQLQFLDSSNFKLNAPSVIADGPGQSGQRGGDVAELTGDTRLDIVTADQIDGENRVFVAGAMGEIVPFEYPAASPNQSVAAQDFNGDQRKDLVSAKNLAGGQVAISANTGSGFGAPQLISVGPGVVEGVETGDFDNNGFGDFVAVLQNGVAPGTVQVMKGNNDLTFIAAPAVAVAPNPFVAVTAPMNADSNADLVVASLGTNANGTTAGTLSVLIGNGNGTLQAPITYTPGNGTIAAAAKDIDGDGITDVACVNYGSSTLVIYRGTGNPGPGMLQQVASFPVPGKPTGVSIGTYSGNGKMSVAVSQEFGGGADKGISLFEGNSTPGNINFSPRVDVVSTSGNMNSVLTYPCESYDKLVGVEDNKTQIIDLTLRNRNYDMTSTIPGAASIWGGRADLNQDGRQDQLVLEGNYADQSAVVYRLGQPDGSLGPKSELNLGQSYESAALGDFNQDSKPDLLVTAAGLEEAHIFYGNGNGFAATSATAIPGFFGVTRSHFITVASRVLEV